MQKQFALLACFVLCLVLGMSSNAHGEDFDPTLYKGKIVYVDFWASWCGPCHESFPWLNRVSANPDFKDVVFVGVNLDQERAEADKFLKATPAQFKIFFDPKGAWATKFGVEGMPYAVILDREGNVVHKHIGFSKEKIASYESQIRLVATAKKPEKK